MYIVLGLFSSSANLSAFPDYEHTDERNFACNPKCILIWFSNELSCFCLVALLGSESAGYASC